MIGIGPQGSQTVADDLACRIAGNPADWVSRLNLAIELRLLDRLPEALAMIEAAWHGGLRLPETATMRGHILADLGRLDEAVAAFREAIALRPEQVGAQAALAALLPQMGRGDEALMGLRESLKLAPAEPGLWIEAMTAAKAQGDHERLLEWSQAAQARFGPAPMIAGFAANALDGLGRIGEARDRALAALEMQPDNAAAYATLAHILLKQGDYAAAEHAAHQAATLAPHDQSGWALLGTAWQLLGDPREDWLCRYDQLVMPIEIALPAGVEEALLSRHRMRAHPADQSLRGGTQTAGNLFHTADPVIETTARALAAAVDERLLSLPAEADHPFLSRNEGRIAFSASWSVRLASAGFHVNHIHAAGWISSALYVSLPDEVRAGFGEGLLTFGVPDAALGLALEPRLIIQPYEGLLVLFPSYLWHGTTPFVSDQPRLTVAFDVVPVDKPGAAG